MMNKFAKLFSNKCSIIGMIHLNALPGTPKYKGTVQDIVKKACEETEIYIKHGMEGILVENMHDVPYLQARQFQPETVAVMARVCSEIKHCVPSNVSCGIQVLACGNLEAIAIAKACNMDFVRVEGFVFSHIADEGFTNASAGKLLRYRKQIDAENILIFTDIKKKHSSHSITADISLVETAKTAEYFLSDGVILTGTSTGSPADHDELKALQQNVKIPVLIGSGVTSENFNKYKTANAVIIGSYFKMGGLWSNDVDENIVTNFMNKIRVIRSMQ